MEPSVAKPCRNSPRLPSIEIVQAYRAIAAVMVLLYHSKVFSESFGGRSFPDWFGVLFGKGYIGVDFFFVLSGFIILNAHRQDDAGLSSLKRYVLKRIIRIFPAYLPISVFLLIVYSLNPEIGLRSKENISILSSLFLIPSSDPPALMVAWTLIHEMVFYAMFMLYFVWRRAFPILMACWALLMAANALFSLGLIGSMVSFRILGVINLEFVGGLVCAWVWRKVDAGRAAGAVLLLAGVAGLAAVIGFDAFEQRCILTIPFSLILLGGCYLEKGGALKTPRPLRSLGDASFAIYLVHIPLISVVFRAVPAINARTAGLDPTAQWAMTVFAAITASILVGVLYHRLYERPIIHRLHRKALPAEIRLDGRTVSHAT